MSDQPDPKPDPPPPPRERLELDVPRVDSCKRSEHPRHIERR